MRQLVYYSAENYTSNIYIIALSFKSTDCNVSSHAFDIFFHRTKQAANQLKNF